MNSTFIRFAIASCVFIAGIYFFNRSQKRSQPTVTETKSYEQQMWELRVEHSFKNFDEWLRPMKLDKNVTCYKAALKRICDTLYANNNQDALTNFLNLNKVDFENFIIGFKILPIKDKYIMAKIKMNSTDDYNLYALFDKTDSLMAFRYDGVGGRGVVRYDSLRVEDWNKDGNLELVVDKYEESSRHNREYSATSIEVHDFNSIEKEIINIFNQEIASTYWSTQDYITVKSQCSIYFEQPDLIKIVEKVSYTVDENIKESHSPPNDEEAYQNVLKVQNDYKNTHAPDSTSTVYYQRDKVSKIYVKK